MEILDLISANKETSKQEIIHPNFVSVIAVRRMSDRSFNFNKKIEPKTWFTIESNLKLKENNFDFLQKTTIFCLKYKKEQFSKASFHSK